MFTHLFYKGVILTSRRLVYDREAAVDVVKSLMQAQHKAVLRGLRRGEFDDKIDAYLGNNPDLQPRKTGAPDEEAEAAETQPVASAAGAAAVPPARDEVVLPDPGPGARDLTAAERSERVRRAPSPIRPAPPPIPHASRAGGRGKVLVSQPPIVVDSRQSVRVGPARTVHEDSADHILEHKMISEKSLDEVILAYLSDDSSED